MSPRAYEDELADYQRSSAESDDDHDLTLSTPTILGLFFGLVIVCGCFFGLGYAMGHRTAPATPQIFGNSTAAATGAQKPTAGSAAVPETMPANIPAVASTDASAAATQTATVPLNAPAAGARPAPAASSTAPAASVSAPVRPTASPAAGPAPAAAPGNYVVQVAAVSSQDVANILLSTLQKKGYAVAVRHEPQDQLLHIQIGPFPDRKDADAMRQRVISDGFNAIVK